MHTVAKCPLSKFYKNKHNTKLLKLLSDTSLVLPSINLSVSEHNLIPKTPAASALQFTNDMTGQD